ncbi:DMT family transporter [Paraflavitalea sp. CAU 1676]|uniref:EamA family transporter n=1 Tax=Paraflavitalea sp. CAU 1676 TaxID=3032598 RepID=UPI0023D9871A|nr:DMT family transporter [Paraflavitalea sp. CAU 1676]MDF2189128.1 DMT family transporter [Paraflavitalea sp. CAU 1676]
MTKYIIMVFAGASSFGILSTFVKLAYLEGYTAAGISATQALTGMLVLWLWAWIRQQQQKDNWSWLTIRQNAWQVLATGAAIGLTTFTYYVSVQYIAASLAIILLMQFTWMGVLLDWILFGKNPDRMQVITIALIIGVTIPASGINHVSLDASFLKGVGYALLSALLYALYVVANSRYGNTLPAAQKNALIMTGSTIGIVVFNLHAFTQQAHFNLGLWKWALFLAVFGTIIPPVLFAKGIPKIGAGYSAIIMTAELPVAICCAHLLLGELVSPLQWTGMTLMLSAIVWMNLLRA